MDSLGVSHGKRLSGSSPPANLTYSISFLIALAVQIPILLCYGCSIWVEQEKQQIILPLQTRRDICIRCWINECRNAFRSAIAAMTSAWKRFPTVWNWEEGMQSHAIFGFSRTVLRSARPVPTSCCECKTSTAKHVAFVHKYVKTVPRIVSALGMMK